ncbi:hypothetical protein LINPERHAP2_LOCUS15769 [Linum perenne]
MKIQQSPKYPAFARIQNFGGNLTADNIRC